MGGRWLQAYHKGAQPAKLPALFFHFARRPRPAPLLANIVLLCDWCFWSEKPYLCLPMLGGLLPECPVFIIDRMALQPRHSSICREKKTFLSSMAV
jgi:hypothetical protein